MRRNIGIVLVLAGALGALATPAHAQQREPAAAAPKAKAKAAPKPHTPEEMARLLRLWEKQSAKLKTLDVEIRRKDHSEAWGDEEFEGRAILQSPDFAWLNFKKAAQNEKKQRELQQYEQIRCTGAEVWQYKSDTHQIFIYPLDKETRGHALEEGPLPFLFNMRAAEAERRYHMDLLREDEKTYVIGVIPQLDIDKNGFSQAFLRLDREYLLPTQIFLVAPDGKSTKDFTLTKIRPNVEVAPDNFKGQVLGKPWEVVRNPGGDDKAAAPAEKAPIRQPALRPGTRPGRG